MLLDKYLPRIDFDSYEDFKENFDIKVPENFNFGYDIVDEWARLEPEKKALVWCDDNDDEKIFTFSDISKKSNQIANYLLSVGVKKGDVIMLILRRRWEYWAVVTAIMKIGAIFIPGSLQLTTHDLEFRCNSAKVKAFIAVNDDYVISQIDNANLETVETKLIVPTKGDFAQRDGYIALAEAIKEFPETLERIPNNWNDIMQIYFTSGTTGMPKMVQHNMAHPLGHIITAKYWQQVRENTLHLSVSDSGWAKFGWGKIYGQWICGATIFGYDMDKFVPTKLLQKMQDYKLTTFCAPPTMYRFMLQEDVSKYDLSSIQNFCTAGEPLNPEVFRKWRDFTGKEMREGFGQSEGPVLLATFPWLTPVPGSTGKPSPLYDIKLINAEGKVCEPGDEGTIMVCNIDKKYPVGLFTGFYNDPEMTKAVLGGDKYDTGDVARCDTDGEFFWFVGRNDDVIKCSGYRIGPFEVESAILEHPACVECAVTAVPDATRGQVVKATIVLAKGYSPSPEITKEIQNHVKKTTAPYKYPRVVEYVEELPKTIGGKIKRREIRDKDKG
ncbi:MAG: AMP-binding protein [Oscillospiraceae bacterium]|jgi:acetyl-CoA synthetase|nr:AMP-binding protein [Oscillospiraceae bacterium]